MPGISKRKCIIPALIATGATIVSLLLHELAHAAVANLFGIGVSEIGFGPFFAYVRLEQPFSEIHPLQVTFISLAGPLMNFLIGGLAAIPVKFWKESIPENTIQFVAYINIYLARLNLIPFLLLDGGKALSGFLIFLIRDPEIANILVGAAFGAYVYYWWEYGRHRKRLEDKLSNL